MASTQQFLHIENQTICPKFELAIHFNTSVTFLCTEYTAWCPRMNRTGLNGYGFILKSVS